MPGSGPPEITETQMVVDAIADTSPGTADEYHRALTAYSPYAVGAAGNYLAELAGEGSGGSQPVAGVVGPVRVASIDSTDTETSPPNGAATIDGVAVETGDRVLLTEQATTTDDGVWVVDTAGDWTRPTDWADAATIPPGALIGVGDDGSYLYDSVWLLKVGTVVGTDQPQFRYVVGATAIQVTLGVAGPDVTWIPGPFQLFDKVGFYGADPQSKPTGVAVDTAAIHAALVTLGLISS